MQLNGFIIQMMIATMVTLKLAIFAIMLAIVIGLFGAWCESLSLKMIRYPVVGFLLLIRGLPEILILFFIYFGLTTILSNVFHHYIEVSAFAAGVIALGLIAGSYAAQVFRGAFLAIDRGQIDAGKALGLTRQQIFTHIEIPQGLRHALPGLSNVWLVLLKDTAIVTLIGLTDMMNEAKIAASTTHQPFTFYLIAAGIYLCITTGSQKIIDYFIVKTNQYT